MTSSSTNQGGGASGKPDRAVVNGAASVSALRASVPSARELTVLKRAPFFSRGCGVPPGILSSLSRRGLLSRDHRGCPAYTAMYVLTDKGREAISRA